MSKTIKLYKTINFLFPTASTCQNANESSALACNVLNQTFPLLLECAAHRDKSRVWNVSKQKWTSVNLSNSGLLRRPTPPQTLSVLCNEQRGSHSPSLSAWCSYKHPVNQLYCKFPLGQGVPGSRESFLELFDFKLAIRRCIQTREQRRCLCSGFRVEGCGLRVEG